MDIVIPDQESYQDFTNGGEIYAFAVVSPTHEEYDQINEGSDINVFQKANTGQQPIGGTVIKKSGQVPSIAKDGHEIFKILIKRKTTE